MPGNKIGLVKRGAVVVYLGVLAWVLTVPHKGRGCHYGRNGAAWGAQTARLDSQSKRGVRLSGRSERGAGVVYLGVLTVV